MCELRPLGIEVLGQAKSWLAEHQECDGRCPCWTRGRAKCHSEALLASATVTKSAGHSSRVRPLEGPHFLTRCSHRSLSSAESCFNTRFVSWFGVGALTDVSFAARPCCLLTANHSVHPFEVVCAPGARMGGPHGLSSVTWTPPVHGQWQWGLQVMAGPV